MTNENTPNLFERFVIALVVASIPAAIAWWIWPEGILDQPLAQITLRQVANVFGAFLLACSSVTLFGSLISE